MKVKEYFYLEEVPTEKNYYRIRPNLSLMPITGSGGSYIILMSRVLGISFPNYIRLCRDVFDANIKGKNVMYPLMSFRKTRELQQLVKLINSRVELVLMERKINAREKK